MLDSFLHLMTSVTTSNFLIWLLLGAIAGIIINTLDQQEAWGGMLTTIYFGMGGALLGGLMSRVLLGTTASGLNLTSVLAALSGGLVLSLVHRLFFRYRGQNKPSYRNSPASVMALVGRKGGAASANPVQVQKYLQNLDYPATKSELVDMALKAGADSRVLKALQQLPDKEYNGPASVSAEIGKLWQ